MQWRPLSCGVANFYMKTIIAAVAILLLALFPSCNVQKTASDLSWAAYCAAYNVNPTAPTTEEENYFLDCWCGSIEEEQALSK